MAAPALVLGRPAQRRALGGRARRRARATCRSILGWGHTTVGLPFARQAAPLGRDAYVLPHVRKAITDAFGAGRRRGRRGRSTASRRTIASRPSEYMAIDHFGITPPGQSWQASRTARIERGGRLPVNPSGGLIGVGHPVGTTGVRMLVDAGRSR